MGAEAHEDAVVQARRCEGDEGRGNDAAGSFSAASSDGLTVPGTDSATPCPSVPARPQSTCFPLIPPRVRPAPIDVSELGVETLDSGRPEITTSSRRVLASEDGQGGPTCLQSDFFTSNIEPRKEIIAGVIREGQLAVLAGTYGVGKSPLLSQTTICVTNGIAWCGREVHKRPVIAFDFESAGPDFKRNLVNAAKRLGVPLPKVPEELEAYVEHDAADAPATAQLLELVKAKSVDKPLDFLKEALGRKTNALVIIDPLELFFRIDTRDKKHVLWLYARLRHLLASFPESAILYTLNLRKKDRRSPEQPNLLTEPRGWLEDVSGSLDILNRCDVRLGLDFHGEDVRVINGVRRGEEMHPILIRPVGELPDRLAGFEACPPTNFTLTFTFPAAQLKYWEGLPNEFRFEDVADKSVPRATLHRLLKKAESLTIVEERDGIWRKKQFGSPIC